LRRRYPAREDLVLTLTYIAFAVLGCGYVAVSALLGHLGDTGDGDAHGGHHEGVHTHTEVENYGVGGGGHGTAEAGVGTAVFHFPFFSPLAVATLLASIGGYGLIALYGLKVGDAASLLIAVPAAVATAYGVTYAGWRLASGSRASSVIRLAQLRGAQGEVTVPIPAGGIGEALVMVGGQRYTAPAREPEGHEVPRGAAVTVVGMAGSTLLVKAGLQGS
jgi:membrane protein implicated in regulation of membrane protease activity